MLGDYIYEYESQGFSPNGNVDRTWQPAEEITELNDYRLRYNSYRLDYALRKLHQNFPWICIWDDHETANDSYPGGADNHQANEGPWAQRMSAGKKAYFEWIPIRPKAPGNQEIFRTFELGDLAKIIMLDTRLEGRDQQVGANDPVFNDTTRTILGPSQFNWFKNELGSTAQPWKIIGNQVMIGAVEIFGTPINTDSWDGYPAERQKLFDHLTSNNIDNMVVLTGDIHTSWAVNLKNGNTPVGVEMVTPSVTSPGVPINLSGLITLQNPDIKYVELTKRGFMLVDITEQRVQGDWYNVNGSNELILANTAATGHGAFNIPLQDQCSRFNGISNNFSALLGLYPNPANSVLKIQGTALNLDQIIIYSESGKRMILPMFSGIWDKGMQVFEIEIDSIPPGVYFIKINNSNGEATYKFIKQ
jgi:alkaline phosphatase D